MEQERGVIATASFLLQRAVRILRTGHRTPSNSVAANLDLWTRYDWSKDGEEWSTSPQWKQSVVREVLYPNIPEESRVLEIGPGAGRWTELLLPLTSHLVVVDLTPECIRLCKERFGEGSIEYFVNDGTDLGFIPDASLDRIWSFDVFVHIQASDIERYLSQFPRILASGGRAVIHHAGLGQQLRGWRSDMTGEKMREIAAHHGLEVVRQFSSWEGGDFCIGDVVSILQKPVI